MIAKDILTVLKRTPRLTPQMIAEQISANPQRVRNILCVLLELKLVKTSVRGVYEISPLGEDLLREIAS